MTSQVQRAIVLRTAAGVIAGLLKNAWAAASTRLESAGVQPGTYRTVILPSGATFGRLAAPEPPRPGALSALLASMPGAAYGSGRGREDGTMPLAASEGGASRAVRSDGTPRRNPELEQALLRLDELLRHLPSETSLTGRNTPAGNRLEQHRAALVASASEPIDRQVIELATRLFESLLADSQLPGAFKPLIARMQIAVLRVVLAENTVLDSYDHPVWRLLDRIGEVSIGYSRIEDPRLSSFLSFASAVAEEMAGAAAPDSALFRRGLNRIDVHLSEQLQVQLRAAQASVEALQLSERREILQQHLGQRLTDQMVQVRTTPVIRRFVTTTWAQVIAEDMLTKGEQSEATMSDLKTVDDLLWSLKIPDHPQSRQRLLQLLPGLLNRLRVGMELVALPLPEQQAVLNELMTIHTEALRPGTKAAGALTPEEIVQSMRDEVLPDAPARSFSDSVIDLSSMETVPAEHLPSSGEHTEDDPSRRVEALRAGDRLRVFLQGRWSRVQLLWRSDRSLFFLFAGESPTRTHSITRRALERLSSGRVDAAARVALAGAAGGRSDDARPGAAQLIDQAASSRSISAAIVAGCSWITQCVAFARRTSRISGHEGLQPVEQRCRAGRCRLRPRCTSVGTRTVTASGGEADGHHGAVAGGRRAQRRGAVVVAAAAQAGVPDLAVLLAHRLGQPAAAGPRRVGGAHVGEEGP